MSLFKMVDVGAKAVLLRKARASGRILFSEDGYSHLIKEGSPKGSVFQLAEIAGIQAAKRTYDILPLCHPLSLNAAEVTVKTNDTDRSVEVEASVNCHGKTGVEMEALTAVSVACLSIYDMCKPFDKKMVISDITLVSKSKEPPTN